MFGKSEDCTPIWKYFQVQVTVISMYRQHRPVSVREALAGDSVVISLRRSEHTSREREYNENMGYAKHTQVLDDR